MAGPQQRQGRPHASGVGKEPSVKEDPPSLLSHGRISSRSDFPRTAQVSPTGVGGNLEPRRSECSPYTGGRAREPPSRGARLKPRGKMDSPSSRCSGWEEEETSTSGRPGWREAKAQREQDRLGRRAQAAATGGRGRRGEEDPPPSQAAQCCKRAAPISRTGGRSGGCAGLTSREPVTEVL